MKKMVFFILLISIMLRAQDKSPVTVKSSQVTSGVVLITINERGKTFDLQCNDGHAYCKAVKPGEYQMVRLAKNRGMYDCQNIDLYPSTADPEQEEKLGEYCLKRIVRPITCSIGIEPQDRLQLLEPLHALSDLLAEGAKQLAWAPTRGRRVLRNPWHSRFASHASYRRTLYHNPGKLRMFR